MASPTIPHSRSPRNDLTAEDVRAALDYNSETGALRWRWREGVSRNWNPRFAGKIAGCPDLSKGYRQIQIDGRVYRSHRLAWLIVTGAWPKNQIDHVNLDKADNRLANLRAATDGENKRNRGAYANNTCGVKGVCWDKRKRKWRAYASDENGKQFHLGYFDTIAAAAAAYAAAAERLHGKFARVA